MDLYYFEFLSIVIILWRHQNNIIFVFLFFENYIGMIRAPDKYILLFITLNSIDAGQQLYRSRVKRRFTK